MSKYAKIKKFDIANGDGVRTSIYFMGCPIHCEGCFNQELWDPNYGEEYTEQTYQEIKDSMNEHISGLSILGGEPLSGYNVNTVIELCKRFKTDFPNKTIYLWTGYTLPDLLSQSNPVVNSILDKIDFLIDGPFELKNRDLTLKLRGSINQAIHQKIDNKWIKIS